jgi:hypothetical protein
VQAPPTGGGAHFEPQTALEARELLLPRLQSVVGSLRQLPEEFRGDRYYIEAQLLPNYLAASHFPTSLLLEVGANPVGSRAAEDTYRTARRESQVVTRRLILAIDDEGLQRLQRLVDRPGSARSQQRAFEEIRKLDDVGLAPPEKVVVRLPDDLTEEIVWEAVLHPLTNSEGRLVPLGEDGVERWFSVVEGQGGQAHRDFMRQVGGLTFAPITIRASAAHEIARFNPLRALRPMPPIRPTPSVFLRSSATIVPPPNPDPIAAEPVVAVFDGGVDNRSSASALFPTADRDLTSEPADPRFLDHGTGVVGAVLYGLQEQGNQAPQPPLPVQSYRVFPIPSANGLDEYWLLDQIRDEVTQGSYRIVNLSLGPDRAVEDSSEPDRWTTELDELASEHDVLFVVAAGNQGGRDRATGLHRVQVPGDMANGLTVGACDLPDPETPWARASYSSMGPGRHGNRIQPAGLQFGGDGAKRFPVIRADATLRESEGTSFAAPLVTHALCNLALRLPQPSPSALRAFAVHFAEPLRRRHSFEELGHGRFPLSFDPNLECDADEVHVLYLDRIDQGELLGFRIPVPSGIDSPLEMRITLAYASPVEATQVTEYTRVSLDLALRPNEYLHSFTPPTGLTGQRRQTLDYRTGEAGALVREGWTMSHEPITKGLGSGRAAPEVDLRDSGKWETVRRRSVRLRGDEIANPRLEVSYLARRNGRLAYESEPADFALLVSIRDRDRNGTLYDLVEAQFPALRAVAPVGARAQVRTGGRAGA